MKLRDLKQALARFGGDDDDSHVMLLTTPGKESQTASGGSLTLLAGIGMTPQCNAIVLMDVEQALRVQEEQHL